MQYIDQGSALSNKNVPGRRLQKKNSLFYQQSVLENEEFTQRYQKNVDELQVFKDDPYLEPHKQHFQVRNAKFFELLEQIVKVESSLKEFAKGYEKYGFLISDTGITYKEWAPGAKEVYLTGDFNNWDKMQYSLTSDSFGNWEIFLPRNEDGSYLIPHGSRVKAYIKNANNQYQFRIPAWIRTTWQNEENKLYDGVFYNPENKYEFKHNRPPKPRCLKIYEVHIGMAGIEPRVHTFKEFTQTVLPRVVKLGYNVIQIMAIQEHAYYGSFGYHVTNFFAVSSRFGSPDDLKELIDTAHSHGITVLMDLVHSHASSNVLDGINEWDGTEYQYFHAGGKGKHELWDSKLFDYSKWEVIRFLLSNLSWWMNEYQFDGFRFDGVTSMLYVHHGNGYGFTGGYHEYFNELADIDSLVYLMLANDLIHEIHPNSITIAEDVSGYPTLCRNIKEGGIGFDYRMAMAVPDKWIKLLKEYKDDDWDMGDITHTLTNRRHLEKCICYAESHDQALVGDKTLSMWLFDKEIYSEMSTLQPETLVTFRGMALHKMLRLITFALGGEGYLNFMGNEFGHPEWIDFPREGNGWSYQHARRRWDLADDQLLRYSRLLQFDAEMINLEEKYPWLPTGDQWVTEKHNETKVIIFERGSLLFVFNFHPTQSYEHFKVGTKFESDHKIVLDTDDVRFGGHSRVSPSYGQNFPIIKEEWQGRPNHIQIYLPNRCAIVFKSIE
ncbi:unnamed protein product [Paramecium primaurelia]|uniref:1,4-alpha-glucan branching enzyme n=1 Tax=Paramecium primaurelia TaxID=5886 RepID=A0A8S1MWN9_PARPR|nr:unnamed protein product [Paramecium primaurelia]